MATLPNQNNFVFESHLMTAVAGAQKKYPDVALEPKEVRTAILSIQERMSEMVEYNFQELKSATLSVMKFSGESRKAMGSALVRYFKSITNTTIRRAINQAKKDARLQREVDANFRIEQSAWNEMVDRNEHILTPDGEPVEYWPDTQ